MSESAIVREIKRQPNQDVIDLLETHLERAKKGEILRLGIVYELEAKGWGTAFSSSNDCRIDAAMLMQLAMRRMGFRDD